MFLRLLITSVLDLLNKDLAELLSIATLFSYPTRQNGPGAEEVVLECNVTCDVKMPGGRLVRHVSDCMNASNSSATHLLKLY